MLYILDYGAGNVASLANSVRSLGFEFRWVESADDLEKADQLLFPGVGAYPQAIKSLRNKGFFEPLKRYIKSGKPYMGICIGMQVLFENSTESDGPEDAGLGIVPARVDKFDSSSKAVPCIGWNGAALTRRTGDGQGRELFGIEQDSSYYFVHSYRVKYDQDVKDWTLAVTRYGDEDYVSVVQRDNVFATQFHPEKSGKAGLRLLKAWLEQSTASAKPTFVATTDEERNETLQRLGGLTRRIVACLDVRANDNGDLVVTKGDQYDVREDDDDDHKANGVVPPADFPSTSTNGNAHATLPAVDPPKVRRQVRNLGKPVDLARRYFEEGADEIALLNITSFRSCPMHDQPMLEVVRQAAETVFVPLTIGGGIRDTVDPDGTARSALEVAGTYFRCGADKVSIGSDAVLAVEELIANQGKKTGKTSIETISWGYGAQAVVVSIDPRRAYARTLDEIPSTHRNSAVDLTSAGLPADLGPDGERYCWYQCTIKGGRETRDLDVVQLARGVEQLGAGEILLNSVDRDGSKAGFDARLVDLVKRAVRIPVIASSGAGRVEDFSDVFERTNVEAALAAGIFHRKEVPIADVKKHLVESGVPVRREVPAPDIMP